jgi:hypothetical protein
MGDGIFHGDDRAQVREAYIKTTNSTFNACIQEGLARNPEEFYVIRRMHTKEEHTFAMDVSESEEQNSEATNEDSTEGTTTDDDRSKSRLESESAEAEPSLTSRLKVFDEESEEESKLEEKNSASENDEDDIPSLQTRVAIGTGSGKED